MPSKSHQTHLFPDKRLLKIHMKIKRLHKKIKIIYTFLSLTRIKKTKSSILIQHHFKLLRSTLCSAWDLASWTSPLASTQQGKLHQGSPAHTARPAEQSKQNMDVVSNMKNITLRTYGHCLISKNNNPPHSICGEYITWSVLLVSSTLLPMARLLMVECCITPSLSIMKSPLNAIP